MLDQHGIYHVYSTPYHPSSNVAVKRINRTIISFIADLSAQSASWDQSLPRAVSFYNSTAHSELGCSPVNFLLTQAHYCNALPALLTNVQKVWRNGDNRFSPFGIRDRVTRKVPTSTRLTVTKFQEKYDGPYTITKVHCNEIAYDLRKDAYNEQDVRAHYTHLRAWHDPPSYIRNRTVLW